MNEDEIICDVFQTMLYRFIYSKELLFKYLFDELYKNLNSKQVQIYFKKRMYRPFEEFYSSLDKNKKLKYYNYCKSLEE